MEEKADEMKLGKLVTEKKEIKKIKKNREVKKKK